MSNVRITFPDGAAREFPKGVTPREVAQSVSPRLASEALAARVDGRLVDLTAPIETDTSVQHGLERAARDFATTVPTVLRRYQAQKLDGLQELSRAPHRCPHKITGELAD